MENKNPDDFDYVLRYPYGPVEYVPGQSVLLYRLAARGTTARRLRANGEADVGSY